MRYIMDLIKDKPEFILQHTNDLIKINYTYCTPDSFKIDGVINQDLLECRGIVFDRVGGIVARPLHKFFNVDENDYTSKFKFTGEIEFTEKMDGSLIYVYEFDGKVHIDTQGTFRDNKQTRLAENIIDNNTEYCRLLEDYQDYTIIFEIVSPENYIVVPYEKTKLVLLAIRDKEGAYVAEEKYKDKYNIDYPKTYHFDSFTEADKFVHTAEGIEGLVIKSNGMWGKLKTPWYLKRHNIYNLMGMAIHRVVTMILEGNIDDALGNIDLTPRHKDTITEIWGDVLHMKEGLSHEIDKEYEYAMPMTNKQVGLSGLHHKTAVFALRKGHTVEEYLNKKILQYFKNEYCNVRVMNYITEKKRRL